MRKYVLAIFISSQLISCLNRTRVIDKNFLSSQHDISKSNNYNSKSNNFKNLNLVIENHDGNSLQKETFATQVLENPLPLKAMGNPTVALEFFMQKHIDYALAYPVDKLRLVFSRDVRSGCFEFAYDSINNIIFVSLNSRPLKNAIEDYKLFINIVAAGNLCIDQDNYVTSINDRSSLLLDKSSLEKFVNYLTLQNNSGDEQLELTGVPWAVRLRAWLNEPPRTISPSEMPSVGYYTEQLPVARKYDSRRQRWEEIPAMGTMGLLEIKVRPDIYQHAFKAGKFQGLAISRLLNLAPERVNFIEDLVSNPNRNIIKNFEILEGKVIAEGATGKVYSVVLKSEDGESVNLIIKKFETMSMNLMMVPTTRKLVETETTLLNVLAREKPDHFTIGYGHFQDQSGNLYIVMKPYQGALESGADLSGPHFARLMEGIQFMHLHGIVHGDIKPANILKEVAADEKYLGPRIADLGGATMKDEVFDPVGLTPYWSAPERQDLSTVPERQRMFYDQEGRPIYDATKSDIFSLGLLRAWGLTGKTPKEIAEAIGHKPEIDNFSPMDAELVEAIKRQPEVARDPLVPLMLELDPAKRPSATEVLEIMRRQGIK